MNGKLTNLGLAGVGAITLLQLGYPPIIAFVIFNLILSVGILTQVFFSRNINEVIAKPLWNIELELWNEYVIYNIKKKRYLFSFHRIEQIPRNHLENLRNLTSFQYRVLEMHGYVFLSLSMKIPKHANFEEIKRKFDEKNKEFVKALLHQLPGIKLTCGIEHLLWIIGLNINFQELFTIEKPSEITEVETKEDQLSSLDTETSAESYSYSLNCVCGQQLTFNLSSQEIQEKGSNEDPFGITILHKTPRSSPCALIAYISSDGEVVSREMNPKTLENFSLLKS